MSLVAGTASPIVGNGRARLPASLVESCSWERSAGGPLAADLQELLRFGFVLAHVAAWLALAFTWGVVANTAIAVAGLGRQDWLLNGMDAYLFFGGFIYLFVAGPTYAAAGSARLAEAQATIARAEAAATSTQLAALRAQLHPHFLFNALHTVVQLIPVEPAKAAQASIVSWPTCSTALMAASRRSGLIGFSTTPFMPHIR